MLQIEKVKITTNVYMDNFNTILITAKFCDNNLTCTCSCTVHEAGKFDSKKMLTCVAIQQKYHFVHHSAIECVLYYHKTLLQSAVITNAIVIMCI